jgi:cell division protein FtsN
MTAEPKQESFEEDFEEVDEFDEEENERGFSGLFVLIMGLVMLGAFASVVFIAYQQGVKNAGANGSPPIVAANPDPVKIEEPAVATAGNDRTVYDKVGGTPEPAEVIAAGPEEPVDRNPLESAAPPQPTDSSVVDDAVKDRIVSLAQEDAQSMPASQPAATTATSEPVGEPKPVIEPTPAKAEPATATPSPAATAAALSGSHLVQVGAFKSKAEADANWATLQKRFGDYLAGKADDVERADLGAKGVFYRLRIGPFASSADAKNWCEGLKSRGADCMVKAK